MKKKVTDGFDYMLIFCVLYSIILIIVLLRDHPIGGDEEEHVELTPEEEEEFARRMLEDDFFDEDEESAEGLGAIVEDEELSDDNDYSPMGIADRQHDDRDERPYEDDGAGHHVEELYSEEDEDERIDGRIIETQDVPDDVSRLTLD